MIHIRLHDGAIRALSPPSTTATQDDAHIYCTPEQLTETCLTVNGLVLSICRDFGFEAREAENQIVTIRRHATDATQTLPLTGAVVSLVQNAQPSRGGT